MIETSTLCCRAKVAAAPVADTGILFTDAGAGLHMLALKGQTATRGQGMLAETAA